MKNFTIPVAAFLLIIAAGFQHRQQSRSEAQNAALIERAAESLEQDIPMRIDDWAGADAPIESRELKVAEIDGCVSRTYTHDLTGETAKMVLACGPPGPISVHTPDICFAGNGYEMVSQPKRVKLAMPDGGEAEFWWADFQRGSVGQRSVLRTFWSWNGDNTWRGVDHPRLEFAGSPILYKLYVACPVNPTEAASSETPKTDFLKALLWELDFIPPDSEADAGQD